MTEVLSRDLARQLDEVLQVGTYPDYPNALNGLQFDHHGPVRRIAAAVDASLRTISATVKVGANFLIVHHGLFWSGNQRLVGAALERVRLLVEHDIAVYAAHLPLDGHGIHGNNALLARELDLVPSGTFSSYQGVPIGVAGTADVLTEDVLAVADRFAREHGGAARTSALQPGRRTRHWAICTGAGASTESLREAAALGIDTLIVGEGPHHTAVEAPELGLVVIYTGHYASETLGVRAVAAEVAASNGIPWDFISAPTGL